MAQHVIATFYRFAPLPHYASLQTPFREVAEAHGLQGIVYLASEGVNGTLSGTRRGLEAFFDRLRLEPGLGHVEIKHSFADEPPFYRLKVRLKQEIVTIGDVEVDPTERVGTYVEPRDWNALLERGIPVIDTRNDYEVRVGTFEGAIDPSIASFRDFPEWARANLDPDQTPEVAMFCTGGIRCEKASSLLLREGFKRVYHLHGGILRYFEDVDEGRSKWNGECFVFDRRVSVDQNLQPGHYTVCYGCKQPVSPQERQSPEYEFGVCCPRCCKETTEEDRLRRRERVRQVDLARTRGQAHIGNLIELDDP